MDDGVLNTLLTLSAYDPALVVPEEREEDQEAVLEQLRERVVIIQSWSAKAVSAISGQGKKKRYPCARRGEDWFIHLSSPPSVPSATCH